MSKNFWRLAALIMILAVCMSLAPFLLPRPVKQILWALHHTEEYPRLPVFTGCETRWHSCGLGC
jgi:hypothetical protein